MSPASIKFHLEVGAAPSLFAEIIGFLEDRLPPGRRRLLDVGTASGLAVAIARQRGWEAIGLEPSPMADAGNRWLGLDLRKAYLDDAGLPPAGFDAILSSEVLEHVPDPEAFVRSLDRHLKPDGLLFLTTPNADGLTIEPSEPGWREMLSPGSHLNIFSPEAARILFERCGFEHVDLTSDSGLTGRKRLLIVAGHVAPGSTRRFRDFEATGREIEVEFLRDLVRRKEVRSEVDPAYLGALYRLIGRLVDAKSPEATAEIERLDRALESMGQGEAALATLQPATLDEYLEQAPAFAGMYAHLKGLHAMNIDVDYARAVATFRLAVRLFEIEEGFPDYPRVGWTLRARYELALALAYQGDHAAAHAAFVDLARRPDLPPDLATKGRIMLRRIHPAVAVAAERVPGVHHLAMLVAPPGSGRRRLVRRVLRSAVRRRPGAAPP
jgi:SAM-dependent methyltransferase